MWAHGGRMDFHARKKKKKIRRRFRVETLFYDSHISKKRNQTTTHGVRNKHRCKERSALLEVTYRRHRALYDASVVMWLPVIWMILFFFWRWKPGTTLFSHCSLILRIQTLDEQNLPEFKAAVLLICPWKGSKQLQVWRICPLPPSLLLTATVTLLTPYLFVVIITRSPLAKFPSCILGFAWEKADRNINSKHWSHVTAVYLTQNQLAKLDVAWVNLYFFCILLPPCYGMLLMLPSTDEIRMPYLLQLVGGNAPNFAPIFFGKLKRFTSQFAIKLAQLCLPTIIPLYLQMHTSFSFLLSYLSHRG